MFAENDNPGGDQKSVMVQDAEGNEVDISADVDQTDFSQDELEAMPEEVREKVIKQGKSNKTLSFQKKHWREKHGKLEESSKKDPKDEKSKDGSESGKAKDDKKDEKDKKLEKKTDEQRDQERAAFEERMEVATDRDLNLSKKHIDKLAIIAEAAGVSLREALEDDMFVAWKNAEDKKDKALKAVPGDKSGGSEKADSTEDFDKIIEDPDMDQIVMKMSPKVFESFSKYYEAKQAGNRN